PTAPDVIVNSIIGDYIPLPRAGPSDGVVPMDSALLPESQTTTIVDASHTSIQRSPGAQQELLKILRNHLSTHLPPNDCPIAQELSWAPRSSAVGY
ncbi:MAG: hypothetical protein KDA72_17645, partial [Planctomycetales bacterium]|nr:hypothetical protein [Planctomycetales bacterium]